LFCKKDKFSFSLKSSLSKLVGARRSTVLRNPLQRGFLGRGHYLQFVNFWRFSLTIKGQNFQFCSCWFHSRAFQWNSRWSAFSSKRLFIEAAFHRMAFSLNAQLFLIFKTVSRISVALLHPKLFLMPLEQIYSKNFCFNEQNVYYEHCNKV